MQVREDEAERVIDLFGNLDGFLSDSASLVKLAPLREGALQEGTRQHGWKYGEAELLRGSIALQ